MGTEDASGTDHGDEEATKRSLGAFLPSIYRRYIGEPQSRRDIYLGFGVFFAGLALGAVALGLFLFSGTHPTGSDAFWQFREAALVFAMCGLPLVAASFAVLLPVGRRTLIASGIGTGICLLGAAWLVQVYPYQWTAAGNDVRVLSTYAVGLVVLAAATGSSLVAQYVDTVSPTETGATEETADDASGETVSDEEVAEDIDEALSDSSLTWGGVEQEPTTERLELDMPETPDVEESSLESATETRQTGESVDSAVSGLRQLQGGTEEAARVESPDDQVTALTEFRNRQETEDDIETGVDDRGFLARVWAKLFG